ncbi:MAG TPA: type VI secretion system baseplate subunit TssG [Terriglobales bacterium]|nr:type VI secretion system baseplate subunit TssG [Terriglobales bacterium]
MAAASGTVDLDLESSLRELLDHEPFRVEFFQAVRLLQRLEAQRERVGEFRPPSREAVRFSARASSAFPASAIHALEKTKDGAPRMVVNFMGLTGPEGALPLVYTEWVMERLRAKDTAARDYFDIFNHRLISLFYRAWEKYRLAVAYERGATDPAALALLHLIGLGTPALHDRQDVPDESLLYYSGILAQRPRSAAGLQQLLADYFDVPVDIEQFAGAWRRLDAASQTCLEGGSPYSDTLGFGSVLGDEVWDQQSVARLRLGPMRLQRYLEFLPTGSAYKPLCSLVRFYFNDELDFQLQLVLDGEETPPCELGAQDALAPQLGWVTWMKTAPIGRDPGDTILRL